MHCASQEDEYKTNCVTSSISSTKASKTNGRDRDIVKLKLQMIFPNWLHKNAINTLYHLYFQLASLFYIEPLGFS